MEILLSVVAHSKSSIFFVACLHCPENLSLKSKTSEATVNILRLRTTGRGKLNVTPETGVAVH